MYSLASKEPITCIPSKETFKNKKESYLTWPLLESVPVVQPRVYPLPCVGGDNAGQGLMVGWRKMVLDEMNAAQDGGSVGDVRVGGFGVGNREGVPGGGIEPPGYMPLVHMFIHTCIHFFMFTYECVYTHMNANIHTYHIHAYTHTTYKNIYSYACLNLQYNLEGSSAMRLERIVGS